MWNKYCKRFRPTEVQWKGGSQTWKFMLEARDEMEQHIWWEPNDGSSSVWFENWSKIGALHDKLPSHFHIDGTVEELEELMDGDHWNIRRMLEILPNDIVELIRSNLGELVKTQERDKPRWMLTSSGNFSVSSAWGYIRQRDQVSPHCAKFWIKGLAFKISLLLWRIWFYKLPIDEVLQRKHISIASRCWCCQTQPETVKQTVLKWWSATVTARLKPLYQATPALILWQIWKGRITWRHGGSISVNKVFYEINRNMYLFAQQKFPWMQNLPRSWSVIVQHLEKFSMPISCKQVIWKPPELGSFKCNTDCASRCNPRPSSVAFCIRNHSGDLMYAGGRRLSDTTNLIAEAVAIDERVKYCIDNIFLPLIVETDSLTMQKILDSI
ncbi:uncharacterized protein LOC132644045 [Lycium barbarum]|uniref:uncharacterized protein LOC132644045 n=1 Tax=Lycium barbarum TaxID=112863 RepID=UPI00293E234A|nr:uncharacterized protein LOC132644045 [Lycium barbarum]